VNSFFETAKQNKNGLIDAIIDVIFGGTTDKLKLIVKCLMDDGRISDLLFLNNFEMFLRNGNFDRTQLRKFSGTLEEQGNKKAYAIALLKAISDVDSEEKARCLANLTQSVSWLEINLEKYFRLVHTLKQLVAEDLVFLSNSICKGKFLENKYLDDYIVLGLIREVDGGYVYTERAWELVKYGISRGHDVIIPNEIEKRSVFSMGLSDYGEEEDE